MTELPPAEWHPDPLGRFTHRYWDGLAWTEHVSNDGQQTVDPLGAEPTVASAEVVVVEERVSNVVVEESSEHSVSLFSRKTRKSAKVPARATAPSLAQLRQQLQLEAPRHPLDEQVEVVGETYAIKGIKKAFRELGMPITERGSTVEDVQAALVPEPWNPHDPNAVAVMVGEHHVGYLPAELAVEYAEPLGRLAAKGWLASGSARIWAKDDGGIARARVTLLIPESAVFK